MERARWAPPELICERQLSLPNESGQLGRKRKRMDERTTISPEITAQRKKNRRIAYRAADHFLGPLASRLKHKYLLRKWSHHADHRSLDWEWGKTNFNRIAVVNLLLGKSINPSYLEIGCASNSLFDSVPVLKKIGVDPSAGGNVRKTSDAFFESNNERFDVIFIDGLHTYEQVRRDIINSIKCLNQGGWIALHDMLPRNWIEHHVPIISNGWWTGDVWKVAFELKETKGLEFKILKIDYGVGVIKVVDSRAVLKDLRDELLHKEFSYFYENIDKLPITEWGDAQEWLRS
jgi:hypothetical protein